VEPIYIDYNASTPIASEVAEAMRPFLRAGFGNPSSPHWAGAPAKTAMDEARRDVAALLGCAADEVIFTNGGSEANNMALKGVFYEKGGVGAHIITSQIEHPAILAPCRFLESLGAEVTYLPVDGTGLVDPAAVAGAITGSTVLVSIMHANNEVGTIQPIADIARITRARGVLLHTDAAQSAGKIATEVDGLGVDLLTIAGHKLYAPKGVGALYMRAGTETEPLIHGAGHEGGRRAGTESALFAAGLGMACRIAKPLIPNDAIRELRDLFWRRLRDSFGDGVLLNGHKTSRLPNTLNVSFPARIGADILANLDGVAASTGSACHEGTIDLSPVLAAMGVSPEVGGGAIRFSLGRGTTAEEVETVVKRLRVVLG